MSLKKASAEVVFDDSKISPEKLVAAIDRLGFRSSVLAVEAPRRPQPAKTDRPKGVVLRLAADPSPPSRMMTYGIDTLLAQSRPAVAVEPTFAKTETDALRLLEDGKADLAFLSLAAVERAAVQKQVKAARFLVGGRILLALHIIVPKSSPIRSPRELRGKRFGVLDVGGVGEQMTRLALQAVGLRYEQGRSLLMGQHVAPLQRGEIEALVAAVPLPSPLVTGLTRQLEIKLLPLDDAAIAAVLERGPALRPEVIPQGSYPGQEVDIRTVAGVHANALVARSNMSDADAYHILNVILSNPADMQRACPFAKEFVGDNLVPRSNVLPSHPGADRYFRDAGSRGGRVPGLLRDATPSDRLLLSGRRTPTDDVASAVMVR